MNYNELRKIIREEIMSSLEEKSDASEKAKQMGLDYMQFGRYGKDGKVTHKSEKGKLVPITKAQATKSTGMTFGRGKNANTMYSPKTGQPAATYDKSTGKIQRSRPSTPPEIQTFRNKPQDNLGSRGDAGSKIMDKVDSLVLRSGVQDNFNFFEPISMDDFQSATGITRKAAQYYSKNNHSYEKAFDYDPKTDSITLWDPADV
jgi:hypothetical protein